MTAMNSWACPKLETGDVVDVLTPSGLLIRAATVGRDGVLDSPVWGAVGLCEGYAWRYSAEAETLPAIRAARRVTYPFERGGT